MINNIIKFFRIDKKADYVFNKEYRNAYNKLWVNNIRDYNP